MLCTTERTCYLLQRELVGTNAFSILNILLSYLRCFIRHVYSMQFTTERTCAKQCLFYTQHYLLSYAPCQKICVLHCMLFTTERNLDLLICLKEFLPSKNFCLIFLTLSTIVSSLLYTVVYSMFYIMQRSVGNECLTLDELNRGDFNVYYLLYRGLLGTSA